MKHKNKFKKRYLFLVGIMVFFLHVLIIMLLWNWLMVDIFNLTKITFLQALGLTFLIGLLLGGMRLINYKKGGT